MSKKILLMLMVLFGAASALFGVDSPLEIMTQVGIDQAEQNILPTAIIWILVLSAIVSAIGRTVYPFIIALFGTIVVALSPDLANSFTNFTWLTLSDGTTLTTQ